jgi:hypothetical protein
MGRSMNAPTALLPRETCQASAACSRCKTRERAPHQRYCRSCHADYMRERRAISRGDQRQLHLAYGYFEQALRDIASGEVNYIEHARVVALSALSKARLR